MKKEAPRKLIEAKAVVLKVRSEEIDDLPVFGKFKNELVVRANDLSEESALMANAGCGNRDVRIVPLGPLIDRYYKQYSSLRAGGIYRLELPVSRCIRGRAGYRA